MPPKKRQAVPAPKKAKGTTTTAKTAAARKATAAAPASARTKAKATPPRPQAKAIPKPAAKLAARSSRPTGASAARKAAIPAAKVKAAKKDTTRKTSAAKAARAAPKSRTVASAKTTASATTTTTSVKAKAAQQQRKPARAAAAASRAKPKTTARQTAGKSKKAAASSARTTAAAPKAARGVKRLRDASSDSSTSSAGSEASDDHNNSDETEGDSTGTSEIVSSLSSSFLAKSEKDRANEEAPGGLEKSPARETDVDMGAASPPAETPSRQHIHQYHHRNSNSRSGSRAGSPDALTASSEGRRSANKWQQHLLTLSPLSATVGGDARGADEVETEEIIHASASPSPVPSRGFSPTEHQGRPTLAPTEVTRIAEKHALSPPEAGGGVIHSLFDAPARAISCDEVLFADDDDTSATPPPASSSELYSIPDNAGYTQTQGATQQQQQQQQRPPLVSVQPRIPTSATPEKVTQGEEEEKEGSTQRSPQFYVRALQHHEQGNQQRHHQQQQQQSITRASPPLSARPSVTTTPTQSPPPPNATHLRMSTPSQPRTPPSSAAVGRGFPRAHGEGTANLAYSRASFPSLPPTTNQQYHRPPQPAAWRAVSPVSSSSATQPLMSNPSGVSTSMSAATTTTAAAAGLSSPANGRLSTQIITRAAAARPLASPGTMWICLDDDDADVSEPTSVRSPTLRNIRIEPAAFVSHPRAHQSSNAMLSNPPRSNVQGTIGSTLTAQEEEEAHAIDATQRLFDDVADADARSRKILRLSIGDASANRARWEGAPSPQQQQQQHPQHASQTTAPATVAPEMGTIGQMLSPTFRHRRGTLHGPVPSVHPANEHDTEDEDEGEDGNANDGWALKDKGKEEEDDDVVVDSERTRASQEAQQRHHSLATQEDPLVIGDDDDDGNENAEKEKPLVATDMATPPPPQQQVSNMSITSVGTLPYVDEERRRQQGGSSGSCQRSRSRTDDDALSDASSEDIKIALLSHPQSPLGLAEQSAGGARPSAFGSEVSPYAKEPSRPSGVLPTLAPGIRHPSHPLVLYDDDSEDEHDPKSPIESRKEIASKRSKAQGHAQETARKDAENDADRGNEEEDDKQSPTRSVKDFIFPSRHGHASPLFPFHNEENLASVFPSHPHHRDAPGDGKPAAAASTITTAAAKKKGKGTNSGRSSKGEDDVAPTVARPVDALQQFFPTKFTKKSFTEAAKRIMPPEHFLEKGQFWDAFTSAEFVGEGSFGLVWRSCTVDGDLVAVKTCPVSLCAKANIEDAFSTLREVAVMRFLNEMQVPYVLPLHSAFIVKEREALPPLAAEALAWRQEQRKRAEAAVLEQQVLMLSASGHVGRGRQKGSTKRKDEGLLEEEVQRELREMEARETPEETATRARLGAVRLPRFLSIAEEDILQSDATVILVCELCDGDVESIPRADGVAKGVAYCVSSALAAMHDLGLLHLDLKPSNILFAYEHGPSQQTPRASALLAASTEKDGGATEDTGASTALAPAPPPAPPRAGAGPLGHNNSNAAVKFYLSDFGNCRIVGPNPMDEVPDAFGTFEYMDLRALRDAVCSRATDNFSLGSSLYEMLFGKRVYPKCTNPKCHGDEDHTRECFVEAAARPIVLPLAATTAALAQAQAAAAAAAAAQTTAAPHNTALEEKEENEEDEAMVATQQKKGRRGGGGGNKAGRSVNGGGNSAKSTTATATAAASEAPDDAPPSSPTIPLTTLQRVVVALLRPDPAERMTAAACRDHLIRTYNITHAEGPLEAPIAEATDAHHGMGAIEEENTVRTSTTDTAVDRKPGNGTEGDESSDRHRDAIKDMTAIAMVTSEEEEEEALRRLNRSFAEHNMVPPSLLSSTQPPWEP